jgi:hypothetical protein
MRGRPKGAQRARRVILGEMNRQESAIRFENRSLLEGVVDLIPQLFDVDMIAVDFFDEALATDA